MKKSVFDSQFRKLFNVPSGWCASAASGAPASFPTRATSPRRAPAWSTSDWRYTTVAPPILITDWFYFFFRQFQRFGTKFIRNVKLLPLMLYLIFNESIIFFSWTWCRRHASSSSPRPPSSMRWSLISGYWFLIFDPWPLTPHQYALSYRSLFYPQKIFNVVWSLIFNL